VTARAAAIFRSYVQALLTNDGRRISAEGIGRASRSTAHAVQKFLREDYWYHNHLLTIMQRRLLQTINDRIDASVSRIAILSTTDMIKGREDTQTPGVELQYFESHGLDLNGIVILNLAVAAGSFVAEIDRKLLLPASWAGDRHRCRAAGIPDDLTHRPPDCIAAELLQQAKGAGWAFDHVVTDGGFGRDKATWRRLLDSGRSFVGEVATHDEWSPLLDPTIDQALSNVGKNPEFVVPLTPGKPLTLRGADIAIGGSNARLFAVEPSDSSFASRIVTNVTDDAALVSLLNSWRVSKDARLHLRRPMKRAKEAQECRSYLALRRHQILCMVASAFEAIRDAELASQASRAG
jgi:hypothetical protein